MPPLKRLLLFDIDGTLIDSQGAGLASLERGIFSAFPDRVGRQFPELDLGGATDGSVVRFLFETFEIEDIEENRSIFYRSYEDALVTCLADFGRQKKGCALPGTLSLLEELRSHEQFCMGLLTGNTQEGAKIKLRHFGMDAYFPYGAFGCDHWERNRLGPIAIDRASQHEQFLFSPRETLILGDTVKDIACARACGAHVLAVATGTASREALMAAEPDGLLDDFSDLSEVLEAIERVFLKRESC
ncbi:MAG: haloacid dehalogenase [Verrucomicrobiales bacterium]|nr:haloacid dehalogenase [Verrucomicrobiales bacterium]